MPADHEEQSQVKEKRRSSCRSEGAQSKPHPKKDGTAKFKTVGMATRVHDRERQKSSIHLKGSSVRKWQETQRHVIQPTQSEKQLDQVSHSGVGPRSGRIPREQRDTGIKDHAVVEYPRKFPRSQQTKLW